MLSQAYPVESGDLAVADEHVVVKIKQSQARRVEEVTNKQIYILFTVKNRIVGWFFAKFS